MSKQPAKTKTKAPETSVEKIIELSPLDLRDLCDATDAAIEGGGGFGWTELPARSILERYWEGVVVMPKRSLLVARLDGVVCGTCQLIEPPSHNQAQGHIVQITTNFVAPWARGYGLARKLMEKAEEISKSEGYKVINLDVRETMKEAITLYESMGYKRIGTHPAYAVIDGKMLKGYYYCKEIA